MTTSKDYADLVRTLFARIGRCALLSAAVLSLHACSGGEKRYLNHYKEFVRELSSETYQGRGYAADGVRKLSLIHI